MAYQTKLLDDAGGYELTLEGKVYADTAPQLKAVLAGQVERGLRRLVVDAGKLEQIDSAGLGVFVGLLKQIRPNGGKIVFFGLNANIERVFEITKLGKVIAVVKTRQDALGSVVS
jgi:anti-sigma B factor antagonist